MSFKHVKQILVEINDCSSTNGKVDIIKKYADDNDFYTVVEMALNPFKRYHIKEIPPHVIRNRSKETTHIINFLEHLASKTGATNEDRQNLARLSTIDLETVDVVNCIIQKDLKCGAGIKLFRKVFPSLPIHEVQLCIDDLDKFFKLQGSKCWSLKLDGVRVWAVVSPNNEVKYLSRNGKEYPNFNGFDNELIQIRDWMIKVEYLNEHEVMILDGEVTSIEKDFQKQMQDVRRLKGANKNKFLFNAFDWVVPGERFSFRYAVLKEAVEHKDKILLVEHLDMDDESIEHVTELLDDAIAQGEEGLILKTWDHHYEYKRANSWCKVKKFHTEDLPVIGWEKGTGKYANTLGYLICDYNGVKVKVGSGFTEEERDDFMIKGQPTMIEVQYQEVTKDGSLRFPTFQRVRDDK